MKQLPTFSLFDLSEEKQKEFMQILLENRQGLWHKYLYYDQLRHHNWLGWLYKRVANYYWKEYYEYDQMIAKIKDKQKEFKAIY